MTAQVEKELEQAKAVIAAWKHRAELLEEYLRVLRENPEVERALASVRERLEGWRQTCETHRH